MRPIHASLFLSLLFVMAPETGMPKDRTSAPDLWKVEKIYIADMGQSDEAGRFRMLLDRALSEKNFSVLSNQDEADAVLTGMLSVRVYSAGSVARATVQLKTPGGQNLWWADFEPPRHQKFFHRVKDVVEDVASDVASTLRKDWNKAAKEAGQPEKK